MNENDAKAKSFWSRLENWDIDIVLPERARRQRNFIQQYFIPLLKRTDIIGELACASGVFTMQVAPFVHEIDAFDLSPRFIQQAQDFAREDDIENIHFAVGQAEDIIFPRAYNHFMCLGLFTCIDDDAVAMHIIEKISQALSPSINMGGGYLIVKDSLSRTQRIAHENDEYIAFYRTEKEYLSLYRGYTVVRKRCLTQPDTSHGVESAIYLLRYTG